MISPDRVSSITTFRQRPSKLILGLIAFLVLLLLATGGFVVYTALDMEDDAYVLNRVGLIRGGIQRAAKLAIAGLPLASQHESLDDIVASFLQDQHLISFQTGEREFFLRGMNRLDVIWGDLQVAISAYGPGRDPDVEGRILELSETGWAVSDELVSYVRDMSRRKLRLLILALVMIGTAVLAAAAAALLVKYLVRDRMEYLSTHDALTELANRAYFDETLARTVAAAERFGSGCALLSFDIDHFKAVNDRFGHGKGDEALKHVARILASRSRKSDVLSRVGGEEFSLIAVDSGKETDSVMQLAERLRKAVESSPLPGIGALTVSVGIAFRHPGEGAQQLCARADRALYGAKAAGRNRVRLAE